MSRATRRLALFALGFAVLVAVAEPALAASGQEGEAAHGPNWKMLGFHFFNISILFLVIYKFGRAPLLGFLAQRSRDIRAQIEAGGDRLKSAETEMAEIRQRLADFDAESQRIIQAQVEQAELESQRAAERAQQAAERIREDTQSVAAQELTRARQELRAEASDLATDLAAKLLAGQLTDADDVRLVDDFVGRVGDRQ